MSAYDELLARAEADPVVAGLVLTGSHARGMATEHSDVDIIVVVPERRGQWSQTSY
jgi:predicted nucleotidyltransferase